MQIEEQKFRKEVINKVIEDETYTAIVETKGRPILSLLIVGLEGGTAEVDLRTAPSPDAPIPINEWEELHSEGGLERLAFDRDIAGGALSLSVTAVGKVGISLLVH